MAQVPSFLGMNLYTGWSEQTAGPFTPHNTTGYMDVYVQTHNHACVHIRIHTHTHTHTHTHHVNMHTDTHVHVQIPCVCIQERGRKQQHGSELGLVLRDASEWCRYARPDSPDYLCLVGPRLPRELIGNSQASSKQCVYLD